MSDFLMSVDETINLLVTTARSRGTAVAAVFPICMEVDFMKDGTTVWTLDGQPASETEVREAWKAARATRVPHYGRRADSDAAR